MHNYPHLSSIRPHWQSGFNPCMRPSSALSPISLNFLTLTNITANYSYSHAFTAITFTNSGASRQKVSECQRETNSSHTFVFCFKSHLWIGNVLSVFSESKRSTTQAGVKLLNDTVKLMYNLSYFLFYQVKNIKIKGRTFIWSCFCVVDVLNNL